MVHLPYFLPDDWGPGSRQTGAPSPPRAETVPGGGRPAGPDEKGFQKLIPVMKHLPEVDLRIAGTGPFE